MGNICGKGPNGFDGFTPEEDDFAAFEKEFNNANQIPEKTDKDGKPVSCAAGLTGLQEDSRTLRTDEEENFRDNDVNNAG